MFYYVLKYVLLGPLLRLVFRPRIEGLEHIPSSGAAIVAGNHLSFSDHFLMPAILKRRITFLAKAEYFTGPGIRGRLIAAFFRSAGQIPVDRSGKDAGPGRDPRGARRPAQGRTARHLPGGHPLPRRPPLQGQGRRRGDGPEGPGARHPLRDDRHLRGPAAGPEDPEDPPRRHPLRQAPRLLPLRRDGEREGHPARHHRRDHVRHPHASPSRSTSTGTRPSSRPRRPPSTRRTPASSRGCR